MHIGFYSYYKNYHRNKLFGKTNESPTPSSLVPAFYFLKEELEKRGHKVSTTDLDDIKNFDAIVFVEFPGTQNACFKQARENGKDLYLIAYESPVIVPENFDPENLKYFKKVFAWSDD